MPRQSPQGSEMGAGAEWACPHRRRALSWSLDMRFQKLVEACQRLVRQHVRATPPRLQRATPLREHSGQHESCGADGFQLLASPCCSFVPASAAWQDGVAVGLKHLRPSLVRSRTASRTRIAGTSGNVVRAARPVWCWSDERLGAGGRVVGISLCVSQPTPMLPNGSAAQLRAARISVGDFMAARRQASAQPCSGLRPGHAGERALASRLEGRSVCCSGLLDGSPQSASISSSQTQVSLAS